MTKYKKKCGPYTSGRTRVSLLLSSCLLITSLAAAQETAAPKRLSDAEHVLRFLGPTTCLIVKVDPAAIDLDQLITNVGTIAPAAKDAYGESFRTLRASIQQLRELVDGQPVFATIGIPVSKSRASVHFFVRKTSAEKADKLSEFLTNRGQLDVSATGSYIVATPKGLSDEKHLLPKDSSRDNIYAAFQSLEGYSVKVLFLPPEYLWRTVRELSPKLPPRFGGGPSQVLTDGVQWLAFGIDPGKLRTAIVIQSASPNAARELAVGLPIMLKSACDAVPKNENPLAVKMARTIIDSIQPQVEGSRVTIHVDGQEKTKANLALLAGIAQAIEDTTRGHSNQQRMKQMLLGIHNYHDANGSFPPADKYRGADGKHHLSWRVHILPYVDAMNGIALYKEFRLEEPWDSPHNKPLIAKMPDVYASQGVPKPGHTAFLAPVGDKTIFGQSKSVKFQDITDGTVNTIAVVEVAPDRAVPWTAPDDFAFEPKNPLNGVRRGSDGKWLCAFADGSVRLIPSDIAAQTVLDLFQLNDGHSINIGLWR
jgi:hypothetical protein